MADEQPKPALKLFISYSHKDDELCERFVTHLAPLEREGIIDHWHDRRIIGGTEWAQSVDENLKAADIIVLLVSPDFLASPDCQEIEMTQALERHARREARIVPVILRPSDWRASRFAVLQAYPTDGKPVTDWPTQDQGFLNVAQGLRRVAGELRGEAKVVRVGQAEFAVPKSRRTTWALGGMLAILAIAGIAAWWSSFQSALADGEHQLDVGSYDEARPLLDRALRLNPWSARAGLDRQAVKLNSMRNNKQDSERLLSELLKRAPSNAYLRILEGDLIYSTGESLDGAKKQYEAAVQIRPQLADGYFRLGIVYDLLNDRPQAVKMFEKAVEWSPASQRYHDSLADQYFKSGDSLRAAEEDERLLNSPIAAITAAVSRRVLGDLREAEQDGRRSLDLLNNPDIMKLPENQGASWKVDVEGKSFSFFNPAEKRCYAEAELSATLFLAGKTPEARQWLNQARSCRSRWSDVEAIIEWELGLVAEKQLDLAAKTREYIARLKDAL
jgi:tetratricopeptide (TPR) repeat protein